MDQVMSNEPLSLPANRMHGTADFNWRPWGVGFGLCGFISPVVGFAFTSIALMKGPIWHGLSIQLYCTVLLFLTIPLRVIGAH
jgi:hypothetical protein